jgi:dihydrofolate reductase
MGRVVYNTSLSLDGFTAGPNDGVGNGLGDGGDRLHQWLYELSSWREVHGQSGGVANQDADILEESFRNAGAVLMGRRMFDIAEDQWGEEPPFHMPVFVVTHRKREPEEKQGGTTYTFVTDGLESALEQARATASEQDVSVAGGANVAEQLLDAGLLDEMHLHVVPVLLGGGVRLFGGLAGRQMELGTPEVTASPAVTHLRFRVAA